MKIFRISQTENTGYDTYDSAVVITHHEIAASEMNPGGERKDSRYSGWCSSPQAVTVEYLGEADKSLDIGFVCTSFNAG